MDGGTEAPEDKPAGAKGDPRATTAQLIEDAQHRFEQSSIRIAEVLAASDPPAVLARLATHLIVLLSEAGGATTSASVIHHHHLELLQAFALRGSRRGRGERGVDETAVALIPLLQENAKAFNDRLAGALAETEDRHLALALHQIRADTQTVRGEFHPAQMDRYLRALLSRFDDRFRAVHGVSGLHLADVLTALLDRFETNINTWSRRTAILFPAAKRPLVEVYGFTAADVRDILPAGADEAAVMAILERWSLGYGDLSALPAHRVLLNNPVWTKPFIRVAEGVFEWPNPGSTIAFFLAMFETLFDADAALKKAYEKARGPFLEDELGRLLKEQFGADRVFTRMKWRDDLDGVGYETDAFVLIDGVAIIFEAKGGRVAPEAKRGADDRLQREIVKLLEEPAIQSARLEALLTRRRETHCFSAHEGAVEIDSRGIDRFLRYNITLNILGPLNTHWPSLVKAGLISAETPHTPTMCIGDLDVVCEILEAPGEIVHYLRRRAAFEREVTFIADEHDLLAAYLDCGLDINQFAPGAILHSLYGRSRALDSYLSLSMHPEARPAKPGRRRTALWRRMLSDLDERRVPEWLELSHRLLNIEPDLQAMLAARLPKMRRRMLWSWRRTNAEWVLILNSKGDPRPPAVFVAYKAATPEDRTRIMRTAGGALLKESGAPDGLVIAFDARRRSGSCSELAIVTAAPPPTSSSG
ncbi:hypothetical protein [Caulobacter hibisci]|uniref:NERD domain-containing protein n=1 Tax=Caulobacter hibisci TaxID=2035993 RepID=A0ABS0SVM3_9CAUL|nr:hypothetical protein [Caulobacter hibisci]MBI1683697.1 hypothetical protein [Caulobacter hibisci]